MNPLENRMAGSLDLGSHMPLQLFAGEAPIITNAYLFTDGLSFEQYEVVALDPATGRIVKHDPAVPANVAVGVTCYAVAGTGTDVVESLYVGGFFNHEALVWEATLTDYADRQLVFPATGTIKIGKLV